MRKLKYLLIYLVPITVAISFVSKGILTFLPVFIFFILVPFVELLLKPDFKNLDDQERQLAAHDPYYNVLLYSLVPIQVGFLCWYLFLINNKLELFDLIGYTVAMGLMSGIIGINLGHELGHRHTWYEKLFGDILLLTSLENHFVPYHNRGHHNDVATPKDPATARLGETLYVFWFRSHFGSYFSAWEIEFKRMTIMKKSKFSLENKMIQYTIAALLLLLAIFILFSAFHVLFFLITASIGILLLETVNYIEHYGLLRNKNADGTYERVRRTHSWNSNHILGRLVLFELSRHSDHHYKPDKHYQLLDSYDESPQMPTGYPGMMVLSLIPPLFYSIMKKRVINLRQTN